MGFFDAQGIDTSKPQAQQNTTGTQTSNVAPWAQPYVNNYLTKSQDLLNQGVQPTALQQQSYTGAANMQMPSQFGTATNFATAGGQGMLDSAGVAYGYGAKGSAYGDQGAQLGIQGGAQYGALGAQYGGIGSDIGLRAIQAQQNYQNMATSPEAMQAYMNPYIQQSLDPQLKLLNQQQALQAQDINAKAAGQGAFGGNRATLAQGLNAQNFDLARQQAIGQGYNTAFNQAQQAQQFGANLGIQGLQTGITGQQAGIAGANTGLQGVNTQLAGTAQGMQGAQVGLQGVAGAQAGYQGAIGAANSLSGIGTAQNNAQMGILGLQNQLGTQQYNLPYQQLQFGQGMLQGLPISQQSTTGQQIGYQAPPNIASQTAGLGTAALGTLGLLNQAGALNGIKSMFNTPSSQDSMYQYLNQQQEASAPYTYQAAPGGDNSAFESGFPTSTGADDFSKLYGASGGLPKDFRTKSYAKGGLVKSGSDLADIRLKQLVG